MLDWRRIFVVRGFLFLSFRVSTARARAGCWTAKHQPQETPICASQPTAQRARRLRSGWWSPRGHAESTVNGKLRAIKAEIEAAPLPLKYFHSPSFRSFIALAPSLSRSTRSLLHGGSLGATFHSVHVSVQLLVVLPVPAAKHTKQKRGHCLRTCDLGPRLGQKGALPRERIPP